MKRRFMVLFLVLSSLPLVACGSKSSTEGTAAPSWTWVSGDTTANQRGEYGIKGTPVFTNKPGARSGAVSWIDRAENLWLFGGLGLDGDGSKGELNDLWRWDGTNWSWHSGDRKVGQAGTYGIKGTAATANKPGARSGAVSWIDRAGNFWLFGGLGLDGSGGNGLLNDLWRWDGTTWTWMSGDATANQRGEYGIKGIPVFTNKPGARSGAVSWIDRAGNLWLFGGSGLDGDGNNGVLNDLWRWDGTTWSWHSGDRKVGQAGTYGTKGVTAAANKPGARQSAVSWIDATGNLWLFGGLGLDGSGGNGLLNDLWRWDGNNWAWMSGDTTTNQAGIYGIKGTPAFTNKPGARSGAVSWVDQGGDLWFFGGLGLDGDGNKGVLNDLWRWDGTNWSWHSGDNKVGQAGTYGTKGTAAAANRPGARQSAVPWIDGDGNFWLFGGNGLPGNGVIGDLNDLWRFR